MDCRGNCLLFVCVFHLLINVECSLIPFVNGGMGLPVQRPPPLELNGPINPMGGTSPCLLNCKIHKNPCDVDSNRKGCPPFKNIPSQHGFNILPQQRFDILPQQRFDIIPQQRFDILPQQRFGNQLMFPLSFSTPPPTTTTKTTTTTTTKATTTTIPEKDVAEKQHNIFTTTTSPSPPSTTTATRGITVNPHLFWMIFNKK